jgi:outer membrane receptor protein involved in Fe transport
LQDLKSQLSYGNKNFIQGTASGGNPDLEPLMSKNFDISYENYYAEGSYLAINYFKKDIEDFIGIRLQEHLLEFWLSIKYLCY